MNQYISDSKRAELDPKLLILDSAMQARDVSLIKDKQVRAAQEIKQDAQDREILDDLRNGLGIKQPIDVFVVDGKHYVVDGFHRTGACLKYLEENPDSGLTITARVIENRTYQEAFAAAQEANQSHGVGVTNDEVMQSKFRALIVGEKSSLSVSQVAEKVGCSRGQANHIARGLKACREALGDEHEYEFNDLARFAESLKEGLEKKHYLPTSAWDSKGFPKIRPLSDAVTGKGFLPKDMNNDEWEQHQIKGASEAVSRLVAQYGEDYFREGLRKAVKGLGLGVSVTLRNKWLEEAGAMEGDEAPQDWDSSSDNSSSDPDF
ncbi:hypothetical protein FCL40_16955 [Ferrimonas sediminicola]|uniref:ParB-like N-terminal domain-containing protein n=1 Tax=Ferrimonas sediminicola TaxID=2569538 RepID=A0A4U1B8M2_9GAMM|nr:ParB N-terminal domain-containing protein [Ferrimonas sediminicola]TKB46864.1 hypothetical protein FCL40_16955 [Ferrimonas sediminicola]